MPERDLEFLEFIVKSIVDNPESVKIDRGVDERGVLITLSVDPKDMGMIIGRQGSTAKAIRTLLRVVGAKNNARVNLKIEEPEGSERRRPERTEQNNETVDGEKDATEKSIDDIVGDLN